jgi:hypothetical protein
MVHLFGSEKHPATGPFPDLESFCIVSARTYFTQTGNTSSMNIYTRGSPTYASPINLARGRSFTNLAGQFFDAFLDAVLIR